MKRLAPPSNLMALGVASVLSAALGFFVLVLAGRLLGAAAYAQIAAIFGLYYVFAGVGVAVQQETILALRTTGSLEGVARPIHGSLTVAAIAAILAAAAIPLAGAMLGDVQSRVTFAAGVGSLILFCALAGSLAARDRWTLLIALTLSESTLRVMLTWPVLTGISGPTGIILTVVCGPLVMAGFLLHPSIRSGLASFGSVPTSAYLARVGKTLVTTFAATTVGSGLPVIISITAGKHLGAEAGGLFAALTLARSPILLMMNGVRQRLLVLMSEAPRRQLLPRGWFIGGFAVAVMACSVGAFLGPRLLSYIYGPGFAVSQWAMGLFVLSGLLLAGQTYIAWLLAVQGRRSAASWGWLISVVLSLALSGLPVELQLRIVLTSVIAPSVGLGLHMLAVRGRWVRSVDTTCTRVS